MKSSTLLSSMILGWFGVQSAWGFSASVPHQHPPSSSSSNSEDESEHHSNNIQQDTIVPSGTVLEQLGMSLLRMQASQVPDEEIMTTRFALPLCQGYIAPSTVPGAGRGFFAKHDIAEGDFITCYPGDVLLEPSGMSKVPDFLQKNEDQMRLYLKSYCIGLCDGYAVMGLPELDQDMAYAGHFINDGGTQPRTGADVEKYMVESTQKANAQHYPLEDLHVVTLATRDIQKDEEIFVYYGPHWWLDQDSSSFDPMRIL